MAGRGNANPAMATAVLALPVPVGRRVRGRGRGAPAPPPVWPVAFGSTELTGPLDYMEDTTSIHRAFFTWVGGKVMHFAGVFDGQGGTHVSALCKRQMHLILAEELAAESARFLLRRGHHQRLQAPWVEQDEEEVAWRAALIRAFARVDALSDLACACGEATRPRCCACPRSDVAARCVGSTAVVAVLVGDRIVVANCGDSRAVLCRGPRGSPPLPLSDDHKPDRPDERARIMSVGGQVLYDVNRKPRVRGLLATSRALGDRFLKPEVICEPEITVTQRTLADRFLIVASDGMWDVLSNKNACAVARRCLEDGNNHPTAATAGEVGLDQERRCKAAATFLAELALDMDSRDNVSVVIVDLQNRVD